MFKGALRSCWTLSPRQHLSGSALSNGTSKHQFHVRCTGKIVLFRTADSNKWKVIQLLLKWNALNYLEIIIETNLLCPKNTLIIMKFTFFLYDMNGFWYPQSVSSTFLEYSPKPGECKNSGCPSFGIVYQFFIFLGTECP